MNGLIHAHSGLRYVVLGLLIAALFVSYSNWQRNDPNDNKLYTYALISVHIQLLLGLLLYFISPLVDYSQMGEKIYRFYSVEHISMMILAIALITFGRVRSRKVEGALRHRTILFYYGLGFVIIMAAIPWPFRNLAAGWF